MKKAIRNSLPGWLKTLLKRGMARVISPTIRLSERTANLSNLLLNVGANYGLELKSDCTFKVATPIDAPFQSLSAHDFLLIMKAQSDNRSPVSKAQRAIKASIIIPVFNKVEYTFQCLRSLIREIDFTENEVIVINNASTDDTAELLSYLGNFARVINNPENLGFVDACNQGAESARGNYLIFLNNDTLVLPGWLQHLLETVENDSSVGAAGSMLLYSDGLIQEAGAGVTKDGNAFHYGWRKNMTEARYNVAREADYCSGASLLVRKDLFDKLGGFDRRYAPAFYEDVDLCFGVRSLGFKVMYQPLSRLIHYEGVTAGKDVRTGFKRFQEINREKFVDKWRAVLEQEEFKNKVAL